MLVSAVSALVLTITMVVSVTGVKPQPMVDIIYEHHQENNNRYQSNKLTVNKSETATEGWQKIHFCPTEFYRWKIDKVLMILLKR